MSYHVFVYNGSEPKNVTKVFSNVDSVIDLFCSIIKSKFNCFETNYEVAFLRCLSELSNIYLLLTEFEVRTVSYGPSFFARGP